MTKREIKLLQVTELLKEIYERPVDNIRSVCSVQLKN